MSSCGGNARTPDSSIHSRCGDVGATVGGAGGSGVVRPPPAFPETAGTLFLVLSL